MFFSHIPDTVLHSANKCVLQHAPSQEEYLTYKNHVDNVQ